MTRTDEVKKARDLQSAGIQSSTLINLKTRKLQTNNHYYLLDGIDNSNYMLSPRRPHHPLTVDIDFDIMRS